VFIETYGQRTNDPETAPLPSYSPLGQPFITSGCEHDCLTRLPTRIKLHIAALRGHQQCEKMIALFGFADTRRKRAYE
jgi:hypothetical protein